MPSYAISASILILSQAYPGASVTRVKFSLGVPAMKSSKVKAILQYRCVDHEDFFLVLWEDRSTSWTRLSNLSCRAAISGFMEKCLKILKECEEKEKKGNQKKFEEEMLRKIIDSNTSMAMASPAAKPQDTIVNDIIQKSAVSKKPCLEAYSEYKHPLKPIDTAFTVPFSTPSSLGKYQLVSTPANKPVLNRGDLSSNIFRIKNKDTTLQEIRFYYKEEALVMDVELSSVSFILFEQLAGFIFQMYSRNAPFFRLFCGEVEDDSESPLEAELRSSRSFMLYSLNNATWILYCPPSDGVNIFRLKNAPRFILMCVEGSGFMEKLNPLKRTRINNSSWLKTKFAAAPLFLSDYLFVDQRYPEGGSSFYVGNPNSYIGRHVLTILRNTTGVTSHYRDGCNVIVHESYYDFLHQIDGFELMLQKHCKFYGIENYKVAHVLKHGCVFALTSHFSENCDLTFFEFVNKLAARRNWIIRISELVFFILQSRVQLFDKAKQEGPMIKNALRILKSSIVQLDTTNIRHGIRRMYWKEYRRFYCIDVKRDGADVISLEDAFRILGS